MDSSFILQHSINIKSMISVVYLSEMTCQTTLPRARSIAISYWPPHRSLADNPGPKQNPALRLADIHHSYKYYIITTYNEYSIIHNPQPYTNKQSQQSQSTTKK